MAKKNAGLNSNNTFEQGIKETIEWFKNNLDS